MLKIGVIVLILVLSLFSALYTINLSSIDNAVNSIAPTVFEASVEVEDFADEEIDRIRIDKDKFVNYFIAEFKGNLAFYQGEVEVAFYFYNVITKTDCNENISCNGVQIRLSMKGIYMFNKIKVYRYEVATSGKS